MSEVCQRCQKEKPNVGPWHQPGSPYKRLCGGCKFRAVMTPEKISNLQHEITQALKVVNTEKVG